MTEKLFLLVSLCVLSGCGDSLGNRFVKSPWTPKEVTVRVVEAVVGAEETGFSYVGTVEAGNKAVVTSTVSGTVKKVMCKEGSSVTGKQSLAIIDSPVLQSAYDVAASKLKQAEDGWKRIEQLQKAGSVPEVKVVEVRTALIQAQAAESAAGESLKDCRVLSPFRGTVEQVLVSPGMKVAPGTPMFEVIDPGNPEIRFSVPESEYSQIGIGCEVEVLVTAAGVRVPGTIVSKGVQASRFSHSYECVVRLSDDHEGVMPGMVCKVFVRTGGEENIVIPAGAVCIDMDGRCVWVVENGVVGKRPVVTGDFSGRGVIIREGLAPGDKVVTEGMTKVSVGMKVNTVR